MKKQSTKDYVLSELEHNKGSFITGMQLAEDLGITRNAIWKAIKDLKNEGYDIKSVNNKGYCLDNTSDVISVAAIKEAMAGLCEPEMIERITDKIIIFDSLESTSQTAKLEIITGSLDKKIIIAREQTAARGHGDGTFVTPEGGIYLSIIISEKPGSRDEAISVSRVGNIIKEVIDELSGKETVIDDHFNRISIGKTIVCGIMTECFADLETRTIKDYIIGIGIRNIDIPKNAAIAKIITGLFENRYSL